MPFLRTFFRECEGWHLFILKGFCDSFKDVAYLCICKKKTMRKTLFILLCVWMAVSCTERPQRPVYHPKLVQIDSILQHDSLKWKNLSRGEMIPDVFLYVDTLEEGESPIYDGTVEYIQETGKRVFKKDMLRPLMWDLVNGGCRQK